MDARTPIVIVSDHAVLRYMQRVLGCDVEGVRRHIAELCGGAAAAGATTLHAEGFRFALHKGTVTTVMPGGPRPSRITIDRLVGARP